MIYRSFTLYDENGTAKSLNGEPEGSKLYFENPTGLGFNIAPEFANIGSGFFKNVSSDKIPQQSIVGDLVVSDYAEYSAFVRWALKAKKLYFAYRPTPTSDEYRCEVAIDYLTKTEKNAGTNLRCPISFQPLTPWYVQTSTTVTKPLDGTYWSEVNWTTIHTFDEAVGDVPAAVVIKLYDASVNFAVLKLRIVGVDTGTEYGMLSMADSYNEVTLSTKYDNCYVIGIRNNAIEDVLHNVDITLNPFFRLPLDEKTELQIKVRTAINSAKVDIDVYNYYRSV